MSEAGAHAGVDASLRVFADGWNAGDAIALANSFHGDASFVNRFGRLVHGRDEIAAMHAPLYTSVYRGSVITCRIEEIGLLTDSVAVGYARLDLKTGDAAPGGATEIPVRMQFVATNEQGAWRFKSGANIAMVDPMTGQFNANL